LLQTLWLRRETRGAYIWLVASTIRKFLILDVDELNEQDIEDLLNIFDKCKGIQFPSILEQLKTKFPARITIDKAVLRVLSFGDDEIDRLLGYLYPALANEIQQPTNTHARTTIPSVKYFNNKTKTRMFRKLLSPL